jgi:hypothetical protein
MEFNKAYKVAGAQCADIIRDYKAAEVAASRFDAGEPVSATECTIFCVNGDVFYFGFDGTDFVRGKYSARSSARWLQRHADDTSAYLFLTDEKEG